MGTAISREKENRIQKKLREAGQMKSAVEGFKPSGRKTNKQPKGPQETSGKPKPWKFPFQKRQPKYNDVEHLKKRRKSDLEQIASLERTSPGQIAHNIVYENILEQDIDTNCYLCLIVKRKPLIECRVCNRLVHRDCLNARGYLDTENQKLAAYKAEQDPLDGVGWSCPDCEDLSQLLSAEEMQNIIEKFDRYDINGGFSSRFERKACEGIQQFRNIRGWVFRKVFACEKFEAKRDRKNEELFQRARYVQYRGHHDASFETSYTDVV
ncbi:PHD finger protein 24 [Holothuria leucospilota]|uniref:PHD finger protein 24 n=1 Tax=Holothuria leucospilota TaxID=206669 RepID=A0A9Q1C9P3_HOLLE|nr:PHD finger protein 24 [Holothuria leucospilota]